MNKRLRRKINKNDIENRMQGIINNIKNFFTIKSIDFITEDTTSDLGVGSVCVFELKELPNMLFKVVLCKAGYIGLGEHVSFDFDLKHGKSTIDETIVSDMYDKDAYIEKLLELKGLLEECNGDNEDFKKYFINIKELRLALDEYKKEALDFLHEYKAKNKEIIKIAMDAVLIDVNNSSEIYDVHILVTDKITNKRFKSIFRGIFNYSLNTVLNNRCVQLRFAGIHKSRTTFKGFKNII